MSKNPMIFIKIGNVGCKIRSCSDRPSAESAILNSSTDMQGMMYGRRWPILKGTSKQQTINEEKSKIKITFLETFPKLQAFCNRQTNSKF